MIDNSHIFCTSFNLLVKRAECPIVLFCFNFSFFFPREYVFWSYYVGVFNNYMKQILKTLISILFDETSLIAISTLQHFFTSNHSA